MDSDTILFRGRELRTGNVVSSMNGLSLAIVTKLFVNEEAAMKASRYTSLSSVVEKIESKVLNESLKKDRIKAIKRKIDVEINKIDKLERYRQYAASNQIVAALLAEIESIDD